MEALYFGCWLVDGASKGNYCLHSCNFRFLPCHHHYKGVKSSQKAVLEGNDPYSVGSFLLPHFISEIFKFQYEYNRCVSIFYVDVGCSPKANEHIQNIELTKLYNTFF